ncbi:phospholipase B1, membrane-associated [Biomphalaria glabrata]|nr:phospholipase B1, membrane-associated [Biomphalaria glabrata]
MSTLKFIVLLIVIMVSSVKGLSEGEVASAVEELGKNETFMKLLERFLIEPSISLIENFPCEELQQVRSLESNEEYEYEKQLNDFIIQVNATVEKEFNKVRIDLNDTSVVKRDNGTLKNKTSTAKSVHELRPSDINVIAALGDSLTAGRAVGSRQLTSILHDFRGLSWSIGGDETFLTFQSLPNILKNYNPDIYGYSTGVDNIDSKLNFAISGDLSFNILSQAERLVMAMKTNRNIDFDNDWKLITVFIGANDLCKRCHVETSPESYIRNLKATLDILYSIPRTLVNLVEIMNVDQLRQLKKDPMCMMVQKLVCDCISFPQSEEDFNHLQNTREEFQKKTEELLMSGVYETRDDAAVVLQPFFRDVTIPLLDNGDMDMTYFAIDCFHMSKKGQSVMGINLWNNMLEPVNNKTTKSDWTKAFQLKCPTKESPFFYTHRNSGLRHRQSFVHKADENVTNTVLEKTLNLKTEMVSADDTSFLQNISIFVSSAIGMVILGVAVIIYKYNRKRAEIRCSLGYQEI